MDEELIFRDDVGKRIHVEPCFLALFARAYTQLTICHTHARACAPVCIVRALPSFADAGGCDWRRLLDQ